MDTGSNPPRALFARPVAGS